MATRELVRRRLTTAFDQWLHDSRDVPPLATSEMNGRELADILIQYLDDIPLESRIAADEIMPPPKGDSP